ncbi:MAG: hypothetical protein DCC64_14100 [Planctomycetota bacterium]|nr:MAG: hypothetical protein DCC64_14100 [Planctomycetota bacterium]
MQRPIAKLALLAALALTPLLPFRPSTVPALAQDKPESLAPAQAPAAAFGQEFWNHYLQGNPAAAYQALAALLKSRHSLSIDEHRAALALLRNLALETGDLARLKGDLAALETAPERSMAAQTFEYTQNLRRLGLQGEADRLSESLDYVTDWWVCGPFANERGQGFSDVLEPESRLDAHAAYTGKDGQSCSFRRLPLKPVDGVVDLGALLRPNTEAVAYLITAVYLDSEPADKEKTANVSVSVGSDGPFRVFLGAAHRDADGQVATGKPVSGVALESEAERKLGFDQNESWMGWRNADPERLGGTHVFTKGWNLVLVKSAVSEGPWRIRVRVSSLPRGRFARTLDEVQEAIRASSTRDPLGFLQSPVPGGQLGEALVELFAPSLDRSDGTARRILTALQDSVPEARAALRFLLAEASKSSVREASGREENKRRELLEQVLKLDPKAARAALELAKYYSATFRNPTEADRYARMAAALAPRWVEARVFAARVATMKGLNGEIERELSALLAEFPDHPAVLRFAGYYRGLRGDYRGSDELFARCLAKGDATDDYCRERLFSRAVERLDAQAALTHATETRRLNPFELDTTPGLIRLYLARGDLDLAMAECERALGLCPRDDNFLALRGEVLLAMSVARPSEAAALRARAVESYREALKANPNRADLARYLEFIADDKPEWEIKLQENIEARILDALKRPLDSNDPYRIVYRDEITVVNEDGTRSIYSQYAYRVCNDDGRELLSSLGAPAYEEQQGRCVGARVYRADGSTEEGRRVRESAEFPPLRLGDVVQVRFRVSDTAQSFFGDFFGAMEPLADYVPVDEVRLVYVLPKTRRFHEYLVNGAKARQERDGGSHAIWTYHALSLPKVVYEPSMPPLRQVAPTVQISTYENWSDWGRWYYNLIRRQLEPTTEMRAKVAELIQGKTDEREKARAIYHWVVTSVRYNADWHFGVHGYKPFTAGAIFERCIGDCKDKAILMVTMLGVAGIKAYPVIINLEEYRGREDITLPLPHHFNHAIACIEFSDGRLHYVDGTATFNGFDELPGADAGAHVIIIKPEGGVRAQIPAVPAELNRNETRATLEFLPQGRARLTVTETATGDRASYLRGTYLREGERVKRLEAYWARHKPGAKVSEVQTNDLSDINSQPRMSYVVELPDAYTLDARGNIEMRVALDPLDWVKNLAPQTSRRTDLLLGAPRSWRCDVSFALPAGARLESVPDPFAAENTWGRFQVKVEARDGQVTISRGFDQFGGVIPRDRYAEVRKLLSEHDRAEAAILRILR